jgi:hypothetical protein
MLSSYLKHNRYPLHIFGTEQDFKEVIIKSDLINWEFLNEKKLFGKSIQQKILKGYQSGHKGTAYLWEHIINTRKEEILIHLDSDNIFLDEVIEDLIHSIKVEGYSIAGSRRPYRFRHYRKDGKDNFALNKRPDVVNTDCFAFTVDKINKRPKFWLRRKILGRRISLKPVVDAFDPITFEIIKKKGRVKYMDTPNNGPHSLPDGESKFLQARISFSAVGSGCNFYKNGHQGIQEHYAKYAIASYSLFSKEFLQKDIGVAPLVNDGLTKKIDKLDKINWKLI